MAVPRIVVIEDDQTLQQFFGMVLEMMSVRAVLCDSAEAGLKALAEEAADVLITDLLLPGLDGRGLLDRLQQSPQLAAGVRIVVMSGSIDDAVRRELRQRGAWRVLAKPVSVKDLRACLEEALSDRSACAALSPAEQAVVQTHFAGNMELFRSYRDASFAQLPLDAARGDDAIAAGDAQALRRVVHNLKSVLKMLGHEAPALRAQDLERALEQGASAGSCASPWATLRDQLQSLHAEG